MGTRTADYLEAIEHLPDGAMLVIPQATWEEYEQLLEDLAAWPGMRVTYRGDASTHMRRRRGLKFLAAILRGSKRAVSSFRPMGAGRFRPRRTRAS